MKSVLAHKERDIYTRNSAMREIGWEEKKSWARQSSSNEISAYFVTFFAYIFFSLSLSLARRRRRRKFDWTLEAYFIGDIYTCTLGSRSTFKRAFNSWSAISFLLSFSRRLATCEARDVSRIRKLFIDSLLGGEEEKKKKLFATASCYTYTDELSVDAVILLWADKSLRARAFIVGILKYFILWRCFKLCLLRLCF